MVVGKVTSCSEFVYSNWKKYKEIINRYGPEFVYSN